MTTPDNGPAPAADTRGRLRKLAGRATRLKLDLHDLAEDLPTGWEGIPDLATRTYEAYAEIARLQEELAQEGTG